MIIIDYLIEENKTNEIKVYRQQLRDFMKKLMNDEITWDDRLFAHDFEEKYLPKLILDGIEEV